MAKRLGFHPSNRSSILRRDTNGNTGGPEPSLAKKAAWVQYPLFPPTGCGVMVAHLVWDQVQSGSIPVAPTTCG